MAVAADYTWVNKNFADLNWTMDYPWSWYWLSLKLAASGNYPHWTTFPSSEYSNQPSYADFNYQYTTTPTVKSVSDTNIIVLSATAPANDANNIQIVLDGNGSINIVVGSKRPFLGYSTDINSDGNATIFASNLTGITDLNSVAMDITPSAGDINVSIDTWNTSGTDYKKWTETGSASDITSTHIIGNLKANTYYTVEVNGGRFSTYQSNGSGQITVDYNGGYSTKTFEIEEDTAPPTTAYSGCNNQWNNSNQTITLACSDSNSGCATTKYRTDSGAWQTGTSISITTDGNHQVDYNSTDNAGNIETTKTAYCAIDQNNPSNPTISLPNKTTNNTTTMTYSATSASGIKKYWVREQGGNWIDNGTNTTYSFSIGSTNLPATRTYCVKATNNSDNNSNETCATITVEAASGGTIEPAHIGGNAPEPTVFEKIILEKETNYKPSEQDINAIISQTKLNEFVSVEEITALANFFSIKRTVTVFEKTNNKTGKSQTSNFRITVTNNSNETKQNISIVERIPKNIAKNTQEIITANEFRIIEEDPTIEFLLPAIKPSQTYTIDYNINKAVSQETIASLASPIPFPLIESVTRKTVLLSEFDEFELTKKEIEKRMQTIGIKEPQAIQQAIKINEIISISRKVQVTRTDYNNTTNYKTTIQLTIKNNSNQEINNLKITEFIPKQATTNLQEINSKQKFTIIQELNAIQFASRKLLPEQETTIEYSIEKETKPETIKAMQAPTITGETTTETTDGTTQTGTVPLEQLAAIALIMALITGIIAGHYLWKTKRKTPI